MRNNHNSDNFAVVIPAYNESITIKDIVSRALALTNIVIVVDDGSTDDTSTQCADLPITLIQHTTNQGKASTLWDGIAEARKHNVDAIITLDADGQHAPEDIPLLLQKYQEQPNNIIIGARLADKSAIPAKRYYANRIANFWIAWAAGYPIQDSQSGFRLYPPGLFENLDISISKQSSFVFESEILIKAARQNIYSCSVPIPAIYTANARPSHFHGVRDITFITLMVAKTLLINFMNMGGLYRSAIKPQLPTLPDGHLDIDGLAMLLLSTFIILITAGVSLLTILLYVLHQALFSKTSALNNSHILVFGKRLLNNQPDNEYRLRLQRAIQLLHSDTDSRVLLLGGKTGYAQISESQAGHDYLRQHGIEDDRVVIEERSRNTLENLKEALQLFKASEPDVTLISNRYHLARICTIARGFGFRVHPCAAENKFLFTFLQLLKVLLEALYVHWYLTGKYWAVITNNQRMLERISKQ